MSALSGMSIGLFMFAALLLMLALRVHIGIAMFIIGGAGFLVMNDFNWLPLMSSLKNLLSPHGPVPAGHVGTIASDMSCPRPLHQPRQCGGSRIAGRTGGRLQPDRLWPGRDRKSVV